ncbi:MAG: LTA synthase family protein, partial [Parasporobacterium sp.]|nr:LTA synthase family protein [Parasporobacterium sp.]
AVIIAVVAIADYFVVLFRSGPIQPWDILSIRTAASVANNYTYSITYLFARMTLGFVDVFILCGKCGAAHLKAFKKLQERWMGPVLRIVIICLLFIPFGFWVKYLHDPEIHNKTSLDATLFTPNYMYRTNGFAVAFTMNFRFLSVDKPDGYSSEKAEALLNAQDTSGNKEPAVLPDVIVIMNECFSDPAVIGDFNTNVDYVNNITRLLSGAPNTVSGYVYASVLGGNTADSEFEFLTGHTMGFLPIGSIPYQQYIFSDTDTVVDQFNALGYHTIAMHPYNSTGWNRNIIYQYMHFDEMEFIAKYKDVTRLRKYVDDASNYQNILRKIEENGQNGPVFVFNVTMQNHSGYGTDFDNFKPEVAAQFKNTKSNKYLNNYLSLIKIADEAVGDLLATLKDSDRPTVVLFFGDHQPNDYVVAPIYKEHGWDIDNQTLEQQQRRHMVPFFIWANFDIQEKTEISTSINYLNTMLFNAIGFPLSSYQAFHSSLQKTLPVINALGFMDPAGDYFEMKEASDNQKDWLKLYETLQYYLMFDKDHAKTSE